MVLDAQVQVLQTIERAGVRSYIPLHGWGRVSSNVGLAFVQFGMIKFALSTRQFGPKGNMKPSGQMQGENQGLRACAI